MNPEIKKLWLEALRGGGYQQTTGCLEVIANSAAGEQVCHCVMGVLCDLALKAGAPGVTHEVIPWHNHELGMYNGRDGGPPDEVLRWAGLLPNDQNNIMDPNYATSEGLAAIMKRNDESDSFEELAAYIEDQF